MREVSAMQLQDHVEEALQVVRTAPEKVREDPNMKALVSTLEEDYKEDNVLAKGG